MQVRILPSDPVMTSREFRLFEKHVRVISSFVGTSGVEVDRDVFNELVEAMQPHQRYHSTFRDYDVIMYRGVKVRTRR